MLIGVWRPAGARRRAVGSRGAVVGLLAVLLAGATPAQACDICAVYTATEMQETRIGLRLGVAEQYTHFGRLQEGGQGVPNVVDQYIDSSITQLVFGYHPLPRFGLQVNVPIIDRNFRRPIGDAVEDGSVAGFGDVSLLATGLAYSSVTESTVLRVTGLFGLKFPSGSPNELEEEAIAEPLEPCRDIPPVFCQTRQLYPRHATIGTGVASGVHGHDLALGSGSTDVIFGAQSLGTWERLYGTATVQYVVRTTGAFGYRYANDLNVGTVLGAFALLEHDYSLGFEAALTCETKGTDSINGEPEPDTALTALYAGPGVRFTWGSSLSAEVVADIPAIENNSGLQVVPTYRFRGGAVWRF